MTTHVNPPSSRVFSAVLLLTSALPSVVTSPDVMTSSAAHTTPQNHVTPECHCEADDMCDVTTGKCMPGTRCAASYWGFPECQNQCRCLYGVVCNRANGECPYGCKNGWSGDACDVRACPDGTFSPPECAFDCHCANQASCDPLLGVCGIQGCAEGLWGPNCQENGTACDITDPECQQKGMDRCYCTDPDCTLPPGKCRNTDCPKGLIGPKCDTPSCPIPYFGAPACNTTCHCADWTKCDDDGLCHGEQCQAGWAGHDCQTPACQTKFWGYPECRQRCFCYHDEENEEKEKGGGSILDTGGMEDPDIVVRRKRLSEVMMEVVRTKRLSEVVRAVTREVFRTKRFGFGNDMITAHIEPEVPQALRCNDNGKCSMGCKDGWTGPACNVRRCPRGKYGVGVEDGVVVTCAKVCHTREVDSCNSYTGQPEYGDCEDGWGGFYCNLTINIARAMGGRGEQTSGAFAVSGAVVGIMVALAVLGLIVGATVRNWRKTRRTDDERYMPVVGADEEIYEL